MLEIYLIIFVITTYCACTEKDGLLQMVQSFVAIFSLAFAITSFSPISTGVKILDTDGNIYKLQVTPDSYLASSYICYVNIKKNSCYYENGRRGPRAYVTKVLELRLKQEHIDAIKKFNRRAESAEGLK